MSSKVEIVPALHIANIQILIDESEIPTLNIYLNRFLPPTCSIIFQLCMCAIYCGYIVSQLLHFRLNWYWIYCLLTNLRFSTIQ